MLSWRRSVCRQKGNEEAPVGIRDLRAMFLKQFLTKNELL